MIKKSDLWKCFYGSKSESRWGKTFPKQNKVRKCRILWTGSKGREWQQEGGSSDKPDIPNLFHHLLPFLPLSLLQQLLESSGRGEGSKEARDERRREEWREEWSEEAVN